MPNRLAKEKSPYLLQHAGNPVDWHPWGPEAFEKARKEGKPVLLSIGYSTCHWCHVMERESFEDPAVAALMNRHLVSIKVDREERPDVDKVYMTAVQAMTGQGGWPLNVFLTPEGRPFLGGTYFPPEDAHGRPGWPTLVGRVGEAWRDPAMRRDLMERGQTLMDGLSRYLTGGPAAPPPEPPDSLAPRALGAALETFRRAFDAEHGGFARAPKFPLPMNQHALFRAWDFAKGDPALRPEAERARDMALAALSAMARGGIRDHVGGGFARYSVDERWHVPHFEKMLYDNAQLAANFIEAFQISGDARFADVARGILEYVLRDMTHPKGGFYSAEDADSLPAPDSREKQEGAFYVWEKEEIERELGPARAALFGAFYGVKEDGNVDYDPHGEFADKNVLYQALTLDQAAARFGLPPEEAAKELEAARRRLFEVRSRRPRPHLDDKVLASWNGLMISALSRAARALAEPKYLEAARRACDFVIENLLEPAGGPFRRWRDGEAAVPAMADDLAFLARGFLDMYESSRDVLWLTRARGLADRLLADFSDGDGGLSMTRPGHDPLLPLRPKDDGDNVEPAAASVAAEVLLRLSEYLGHAPHRRAAEKILAAHGGLLAEEPLRFPHMLTVLLAAARPPAQIVVAGDPADPRAQALWAEADRRFLPRALLFPADGGPAQAFFGERLAAFKPAAPAAHLCRNFSCRAPAADPKEFAKALSESEGP